jgi:hypothetical protein
MSSFLKIKYDTEKYNFKALISEIFEYDDLSKIHKKADFTELIKISNTDTHKFQQSEYHQIYYKNFYKIKPLYEQFILEVLKPIYNNKRLVFQATPTFRLHFPMGTAVGMFHKDKDLRDYSWHEKIKEDNFYLPFTDAYDSNTIWYETEEDKGDFTAMNCKYGEAIRWDGTNLKHGNKTNLTEDTRISMDFRVTTEELFINNTSTTKNDKTTFSIGGYYGII